MKGLWNVEQEYFVKHSRQCENMFDFNKLYDRSRGVIQTTDLGGGLM